LTQPLLSGTVKESAASQQHQSASHPSTSVSQPPLSTRTSATGSDVSRPVSDVLRLQRTVSGLLDRQIADVATKISQHELAQQQGSVGTRPSTLRWNLVPDEHIISPRRSRHRGSWSPAVSEVREIPAPPHGPDTTFAEPLPGLQTPAVQTLTDIQNYPSVDVPTPKVVGPGTAEVTTDLGVLPATEAPPTFDLAPPDYQNFVVSGSADKIPTYGQIQPHANRQDGDTLTANADGGMQEALGTQPR